VTKLAGMAILGAAGATIINSLFSSDAWNNVLLYFKLKEYSQTAAGNLYTSVRVICHNKPKRRT
jgi:APA family basic amino acid/polyamine antiporter